MTAPQQEAIEQVAVEAVMTAGTYTLFRRLGAPRWGGALAVLVVVYDYRRRRHVDQLAASVRDLRPEPA
jgi:hypothetical protein